MAVTYKNTWDEIQEELGKLLHSRGDERLLPQYAFEIKSAIESIEQQKRIAELQQNVIAQQQENISYTKNLAEYQRESTFYSSNLVQQLTGVNYLDWQGSRDQIAAIDRFSKVSDRQEIAVRNLSQSLRLIPSSISDFSESVQALQSIQEQIDALREDYQKLEKNQKRVMKKIKLRVK